MNRKTIGKLLRRVLPWKVYKLIANGFMVVPCYYRDIISEAEQYFDFAAKESDERTLLLLRKHAHIIDKGLHRSDVSPNHGKENYEALCREVKILSGTRFKNDPTYQWAVLKLKQYESLQEQPSEFVPLSGAQVLPAVTYDRFLLLARQRRSNRFFTDRPLTEDVVDKIKEAALWAASSCNKQAVKLFETTDMDIARQCLSLCAGGTCFGEIIPSFWAFAADTRGYVWPSEMYLPSVDTSLAAQNAFLAAQTLGVTGTILSWSQRKADEQQRLRQLLEIPDEYMIVFCGVMGYASQSTMTPPRKSVAS